MKLTDEERVRVEDGMGLVMMVVGQYVGLRRVRPEDKEDAIAAGVCGLARAVQQFDPNGEWAFSTVAVRQIKNAIANDPLVGHVRRTRKGHSSRFQAVSLDTKPWRISSDGSYNYQPTNDAAHRWYDPVEELHDQMEGEAVMDLMFNLVDRVSEDERIVEETRQALHERFVTGLSIREIADSMGYSTGTITKRINRVLKEVEWLVERGLNSEWYERQDALRRVEEHRRQAYAQDRHEEWMDQKRRDRERRAREKILESKRLRIEKRRRRRRARRKAIEIEHLRDLSVGPRGSAVMAEHIGRPHITPKDLDIRVVRMSYSDLGVRWMVVHILPSGRSRRLGVVYVSHKELAKPVWAAISSSGSGLRLDGLDGRHAAIVALVKDHGLISEPKPPKKKPVQPLCCVECGHSKVSFHGAGRCAASGCGCPFWRDQDFAWATSASVEWDDPRRADDF